MESLTHIKQAIHKSHTMKRVLRCYALIKHSRGMIFTRNWVLLETSKWMNQKPQPTTRLSSRSSDWMKTVACHPLLLHVHGTRTNRARRVTCHTLLRSGSHRHRESIPRPPAQPGRRVHTWTRARRKGLGSAAAPLCPNRASRLSLSLLSLLSSLFESLSPPLSLAPGVSPFSLALLALELGRSVCSQGLQSSLVPLHRPTRPISRSLSRVGVRLLACVWRRHFWRTKRSPPSPSWLPCRYDLGGGPSLPVLGF